MRTNILAHNINYQSKKNTRKACVVKRFTVVDQYCETA